MNDVNLVLTTERELRRLIREEFAEAREKSGNGEELVDAAASGLPRRLFRRLVREGTLPASRVGRKYVARRSDVDAYLASQQVAPGGVVPGPTSEVSAADKSASAVTAPASEPIAIALEAGRLRKVK